MCGAEEETLEHVMERCGGVRDNLKNRKVGEVLREDGGGRRWLREIEKEREGKLRNN